MENKSAQIPTGEEDIRPIMSSNLRNTSTQRNWTHQLVEGDMGQDIMPDPSKDTIAEEIFFDSYDNQVEKRRRQSQERRRQNSGLRRLTNCRFVAFWSKLPHLLWSLFIETLYIPAYRFEWGKFRNWTYEKYGQKAKHQNQKRIKDKEQRHMRRHFIRIRRKEAEYSGALMRDKHLGCRRVRINCGGVMFETQARTILQFPDTLLGDPVRRMRYWNPKKNEYYFDRNSECFESIIHFYQTGGSRLERPQHLRMEDFRLEIKFFDIKGHRVDEFAAEDSELKDKVDLSNLPVNLLKRKIWLLLEYPTSSHQAQLFSYLSISAIILSTVTYCLDTMDLFRGSYARNIEVVDLRDPMFLTETICVIFFTLELIGRLCTCPRKITFIQSFPNIIDCISIIPFALEISVYLSAHLHGGRFNIQYINFEEGTILEGVHRLAKVIRVFRILKLSRYSLGLRILGQTLHASLHELALLAFFLMVGVILFSSALYFIEGYYNPTTQFTSIPGTFFWAVSAMTTTGFDRNEELPKTVPGKVIGSVCAIAGVLTLSLPVPVVVANFTYFYHRGMQSKKNDKNKKLRKVERKKKHIGACPFLPTCEADHHHLESAQVLSKASELGAKRWQMRSAKRRPQLRNSMTEDESI